MPLGNPGIWCLIRRRVCRALFLQRSGRRECLAEYFAAWFDALAMDCRAYASINNLIHVVVRMRPDVAVLWSNAEVTRRYFA